MKYISMLVLLISFCCFPAFFYFWSKKRSAKKAAGENYQNDMDYLVFRDKKNLAMIFGILTFFFGMFLKPDMTPEEKAILAEKERQEIKQSQEKFISTLDENYKNFYDIKFNEYVTTGKDEYDARTQAVKDVKNKKNADEEKILSEKKAAEEKLAAEKKAEEERLAAEKKAVEEKLTAEKKAEEERLAAEKKAEEEKLAAEKKAEEERLAAEKKSEQEKPVAEKNDEPGLIDKAKEKIKDLATSEIEKMRQEAENLVEGEVFVGHYDFIEGVPISVDCYVLPKTVKPYIYGIVFKTDEGFKIHVAMKDPNTGKKMFETVYAFDNNNNILEDESNVKFWTATPAFFDDEKFEGGKYIEDNQTALEIYRVSKKFSLLK